MKLAEFTRKQTEDKLRQNKADPAKITSYELDESGAYVPVVSTQKVLSINTISGAVTLVAGDNVVLTPSGQSITIDASGVEEFTELLDAPASYLGEAGKIVAVNALENALEFIPMPSGASAQFDFGSVAGSAGTEFDQDWGTL